MNHPGNGCDEIQITAYALGELEGAERSLVEAALRADPVLRAEVEAIRATAAGLEAALAGEAAAATAPSGVGSLLVPFPAAVAELAGTGEFTGGTSTPSPVLRDYAAGLRRRRSWRAEIFRFPRFYYLAGGLAAAGLAVVVGIQREEYDTRVQAQATLARIAWARHAADREMAARLAMLRGALPVFGSSEYADAAGGSGGVGTAGAVAGRNPERGASAGSAAGPRLSVGRDLSLLALARPDSLMNRPELHRSGVETSSAPGRTLAMAAFPPELPGEGRPAVRTNTETYAHGTENPFLRVTENPLSTFAIDADTASYANVRRFIQHGARPPREAVRIEELLNYFPFRYPVPAGDAPFAASLEVAAAPWAPAHRLVRIGLKGREVSTAARPAANLVFLIDVSASMDEPDKLPLVKESLHLLLGRLRSDDRIAIVTYAGQSGLALPSTPAGETRTILAALDTLAPGGPTNGAMGIHLAYDIAKANFARDGINRVILCTDGDFNVGATSESELVRLIEDKAATGVYLTVLGFGMGNLKDATLEKLADRGNGTYGYVDTRREAEKILGEQVNGTLMTIAKDVKIQVEFNPALVARYRLIGYENRPLRPDDFNDDSVDAGEIGAGHTLTALYEIVPWGAEDGTAEEPSAVDALRYRTPAARGAAAEAGAARVRRAPGGELLTMKVRYKRPDGASSQRLEFAVADEGKAFAAASADFRFAAAVAEYGMILRGSQHRGSGTLGDVLAWATAAMPELADDPGGHRVDFLDLVRRTQGITE